MREITSHARVAATPRPAHPAKAHHPQAAEAGPLPRESFVASPSTHPKPALKAQSHAQSAHATAAHASGMVLGAGVGVAIVGPAKDAHLKKLAKLVKDVRSCLSDELRKQPYRGNPNPMAGHCYVASEALYHKLGGKEAGWTPQHIKHEGGPHWFLANADGTILDPTSDQFKTPVPYDEGIGSGFLTRDPSKRTQIVLARLEEHHPED